MINLQSRILYAIFEIVFLYGIQAVELPAQSSFHGLVVFIDFSDFPANVDISRADDIINTAGYTEPTVTASLRDYWYAQSRQQVIITHDVFGYYRAPQTAAWYNTMSFQEFIVLAKD